MGGRALRRRGAGLQPVPPTSIVSPSSSTLLPLAAAPRYAPRMRARSSCTLVTIAALTAVFLPGCANPWADHFRFAATTQAQPLPLDAQVRTERVSFEEAMTVQEHGGMRLLGRSWFFDNVAHSEERAAALARSIGATVVLWGRTEPMRFTRTVTARMPVTERTRTTGRITDPDGRVRDVDLTSTAARWEDVTSEVVGIRYGHAAAFFAPNE